MPTTETRVKFFDIDKCGYYKRRSSHPDFCSSPELLEDLVLWVADKSIAETATYTPSEEQDEATLRTFCFDIREADGSYLLTTWNETPTLGGGVASVDLQGNIGNATIETAEVSTGFVPGYPSYFWFPNGTNHLVTVQIGNRLNGKANLCLYIEEYLKKYSCHAVLGEVEDDEGRFVEKVIGYSESGEEAGIGEKQVKPRFQASQLTTVGDLDFIRQYVGSIRKIIKKDRISLTVQEKLRWWQAATRIFRNDNQSLIGNEQHKIKIELEFTPTLEELNACLLYTSPSPRDQRGSRMPSSA